MSLYCMKIGGFYDVGDDVVEDAHGSLSCFIPWQIGLVEGDRCGDGAW